MKLRNSRAQHHGKEVNEQIRVFAQHIVSRLAAAYVKLPSLALYISNDCLILMRKYKRGALSLDSKLALVVSQKVTKINVEQVTEHGDHDVVIVTITDTQNICGHAEEREGKNGE